MTKRPRKKRLPPPPPEPQTVTQWSLCERCGSPGLAFIEQFSEDRAICGYCGGKLVQTTRDLTDAVRHVEDEPLHRWHRPSRGPSLDEQCDRAIARDK